MIFYSVMFSYFCHVKVGWIYVAVCDSMHDVDTLHYVNVSVLIKFSQKTSVFTLIVISSP